MLLQYVLNSVLQCSQVLGTDTQRKMKHLLQISYVKCGIRHK